LFLDISGLGLGAIAEKKRNVARRLSLWDESAGSAAQATTWRSDCSSAAPAESADRDGAIFGRSVAASGARSRTRENIRSHKPVNAIGTRPASRQDASCGAELADLAVRRQAALGDARKS
jgi:hypothetical protein